MKKDKFFLTTKLARVIKRILSGFYAGCYAYWLYLTNKPRLLNFVILGGQKCASSSLAYYLANHPACGMTFEKESRSFSKYYTPNHSYLQIMMRIPFKHLRHKDCQLFEATTENYYREEVAERLYRYNPDLKLILLVRDPVSRAFSEYQFHYNLVCMDVCLWEDPEGEYSDRIKDAEHYPFSWFVDEELRKIKETNSVLSSAFGYPDYLRHGLYSEHVKQYYRYFKPEQLLIIEDKELRNNKKETLYRIETFLGISHIEWLDNKLKNQNIGIYRFSMPEDCREKLKLFFAPWNEAFFSVINRKMDW